MTSEEAVRAVVTAYLNDERDLAYDLASELTETTTRVALLVACDKLADAYQVDAVEMGMDVSEYVSWLFAAEARRAQ